MKSTVVGRRMYGETYVMIREDFLEIAKGDHCTAALFSLIEYWANAEVARNPNTSMELIYLGQRSAQEWWKGTMKLYAQRPVMKRVAWLVEQGYLQKKDFVGKHSKYWLNLPLLQSKMDAIAERYKQEELQKRTRKSSVAPQTNGTNDTDTANPPCTKSTDPAEILSSNDTNAENPPCTKATSQANTPANEHHDPVQKVVRSHQIDCTKEHDGKEPGVAFVPGTPNKSDKHLYMINYLININQEEKEENEDASRNTNKESTGTPSLTTQASEELLSTSNNPVKDQCSAGARDNKLTVLPRELGFNSDRLDRQQRQFNWVPDGEWKVDGKLDAKFVDWVAAKWEARFGGDRYINRANVLKHFKNDAANLAIEWDCYHAEALHRVAQTAQIVQVTGEMRESDKQIIEVYSRPASLPCSNSPLSEPLIAPIVQEVSQTLLNAPAMRNGHMENPNAYRVFSRASQELPAGTDKLEEKSEPKQGLKSFMAEAIAKAKAASQKVHSKDLIKKQEVVAAPRNNDKVPARAVSQWNGLGEIAGGIWEAIAKNLEPQPGDDDYVYDF